MDGDRRSQRGQTLVLFALFLTAMVAASGLVVDVGGAWGQQRSQQKAADSAALAGATAESNGATKSGIIAAAVANAVANGYKASEVTVNIPPTSGDYAPGGSQSGPLSANDCSGPGAYPCWVEVVIDRAHTNAFASIVPGQGSWPVGARGVAVGGIANAVKNGIAPLMFNYRAVSAAPGYDPSQVNQYCDPQNVHCPPQTTFPWTVQQFNWTTFCVDHPDSCNVDANTAKDIINGGNIQVSVYVGEYLGPHNNGSMDSVCQALVDQNPSGGNLPVAISNDNGDLVGFWVWHFDPSQTNCTGDEVISGSFVNDITQTLPLTISAKGSAGTFGQYVVRLVE